MPINKLEFVNHCTMDHVERWRIMREVTDNNLGEIICTVEARDNRWGCLTNTGVYAIVNHDFTTLITAYLPSYERVRQMYKKLGQKIPQAVRDMVNINLYKESLLNGGDFNYT